jgi:hypothetical protein
MADKARVSAKMKDGIRLGCLNATAPANTTIATQSSEASSLTYQRMATCGWLRTSDIFTNLPVENY